MLSKKEVRQLRREFPMFAAQSRKPFVYLDSAASSQTPRAVLAAMDGFYKKYRANVHRGMYPASLRATETYEAARIPVAKLIGADPREIVFTRGATESLNLLAYTLSRRLGPGDEVVVSIMEHHSNLVPWQQLARERGFAVKFIGVTPDFQLDLAAAAKLITPATKVVSVMHVSNALGTVNPVEKLAALAHKQGAIMIVDAAQSAGHRPLDVKKMDCDFLAFSGHKMFGPTGSGVLYGKRSRLEELPPFLYGGDMILEVTRENAVWNEVPWKFEAGTPNIAGGIGLGAAAEFAIALDPAVIHEHELALARIAMAELSKIPGVKLYGPPAGSERGGVVSFTLGDIHVHDMANILGDQGVCVRGGHHCAMPLMRQLGINGTTRASFSIYNDTDDIAALAAAVRRAKKLFKL
jgi:cysteine desulfurase/selenocysteine lyase